MDSYTMIAIAYTTKDGSPFELTSPVAAAFTGAHVYETFTCTQAVDIEDANSVELSATLTRVVSMLTVVSTDTLVRMTFSAGGKSFNPTTGLATVNTGFATTSSSPIFLAIDEQTMNVTIDVLNADGHVLSSKLVENVPFRRNRRTKLTGPLYSAPAAASFLLSTDWIEEESRVF